MKLPEINWIGLIENDAHASIGDYLLRFEKMDAGYWWWRVYHGDDTIAECNDNKYSFAKNKVEAKLMAEIAFLRHFVENNLTEKL